METFCNSKTDGFLKIDLKFEYAVNEIKAEQHYSEVGFKQEGFQFYITRVKNIIIPYSK